MMIQKKLNGLEIMDVLTASYVKVFLGNKYNSYIHTAGNAKVTFTRNVYKNKTVIKWNKVFRGVFRSHQGSSTNIYDDTFKKIVNCLTKYWLQNTPLVLITAKKLPPR